MVYFLKIAYLFPSFRAASQMSVYPDTNVYLAFIWAFYLDKQNMCEVKLYASYMFAI